MMVQMIIDILIIIEFSWIAVVTFLLVRTINHYNRLIGNSPKGTLKEMLDTILTEEDKLHQVTNRLEKDLHVLQLETKMHIQKVGIVRFNPFADTGGSQSFCLALMDSKNNGVVMTSLYTRTGGRWYIKHVVGGVGEGVDLSKEEQTAITKAKYIVDMKG